MKLILACGSTNPIEQIVWMSREQFEKHIQEELVIRTEEQATMLFHLKTELGISPMDNPFDYVKEVQTGFINSGIQYSDEYYDVLGLER